MPRFGPPGEQVGYEVHAGPEGAKPLVLLHGFTASSAAFLTNIPGLARHFTVVAVDLLGHGGSDAPVDVEPYRPGPAERRLAGLWDSLGYQRVLLAGHSLGGALALRAALDMPDRIVGLVMVNSMSAVGTPAWRESAARGMGEMAARIRRFGPAVLKETRLYPARSARLPADAREALARDFDRLTGAGIAGTAEGLTAEVNCYERLHLLRVPMLITYGDRETEFVKALPGFLERLPPGVMSVVLRGAGHAANLEQPDAFNAAVVEFAVSLGWLPSP